jgi:hypothetical protein
MTNDVQNVFSFTNLKKEDDDEGLVQTPAIEQRIFSATTTQPDLSEQYKSS